MSGSVVAIGARAGPEACTRAKHVRDSARADPAMKDDRDSMQALEKVVTQACK